MIIELQRTFTPEEMQEWECGLCGRDFEVESVIADAMTDDRYGIGRVCPSCVAYFGQRNPGRCPTLPDYRDAVRRYPEPIWPDYEAAVKAEEGGAFEAEYAKSFVWRAGAFVT